MNFEILTKSDLHEFKKDLLQEMKSLIKPEEKPRKAWLKSNDVREILGCSHGTLQNLRIRGALTPTKIGGIWYYQVESVNNLLENGMQP